MDNDLMKAMQISASGLKAQTTRMRIIAENLANSGSEATAPNEDPYRRKIVSFANVLDRTIDAETVKVANVKFDQADFGMRFDPGHPGADAAGYVKTTNVNGMIEAMDMSQAQRTYQANLNAIDAVKSLSVRTLEILR
ncbi:flagellar basal-body rod protein FlgC [Iodidimonas nitroreducens]|uniref:Flagellar basal-body rod protein FlgC n=2 Tax=Iodidimonas nitroreducens TaxID=1236968 RepID=A0A5A7N7D6_9PROT|nr:flagellar basal body rod protein FlgC [Iodidimonas nitroreducens]GAK34322.1 flagellar basal-body rod protein FlgC [alpha proteobacterium Q-1]GER03555.1 flagellar basal-body rod protein FlgC [Iodidimonas nitroreducens]